MFILPKAFFRKNGHLTERSFRSNDLSVKCPFLLKKLSVE
jgi:hypothetical protein